MQTLSGRKDLTVLLKELMLTIGRNHDPAGGARYGSEQAVSAGLRHESAGPARVSGGISGETVLFVPLCPVSRKP